jgi:putative ABC transport system substrate-binding protein
MRRRELIAGLAGAAVWQAMARAQKLLPTIGFLHPGSPSAVPQAFLAEFHRGLADNGWAVGGNVNIEYRWAEGRYERLPTLVADLVRRQVAAIAVPNGTAAALTAKAATQSIPIVFFIGPDPVEIGLVNSLSRPGGNVTGVTSLSVETTEKRVELIHELVPSVGVIGLLVNPGNPVYTEANIKVAQGAVRVLGPRLFVLNAGTEREIEVAFEAMDRERVGALVITGDQFFTNHPGEIAGLAMRHMIPTIEQTREFTAAGGLMSFGTSYQEAYRLVGNLTGRILHGEKPSDLPVEQVTKHEFVINLKTAKSFGITFPQTLLVRADEVIE